MCPSFFPPLDDMLAELGAGLLPDLRTQPEVGHKYKNPYMVANGVLVVLWRCVWSGRMKRPQPASCWSSGQKPCCGL